ncbi:SH3 domain-containing protein [Celeribacter arenosi]|uniref:SH3b domain-containing protein n=1 Tax=Celeribacter arenosi TaxID=792649 RepID=A0ABP7K0S7_9RHOB
MLKLVGATLAGVLGVMTFFGGELSSDEKAELAQLRGDRMTIEKVWQSALPEDTDRSEVVKRDVAAPRVATTTSTEIPLVHLAAFEKADAALTTSGKTTQVSHPDKLAALIGPSASGTDADERLRVVTGSRVNVRSGPSTSHDVLGQVVKAEIVAITEVAGEGWVRISVQGDGVEGYIAARFLDSLDG